MICRGMSIASLRVGCAVIAGALVVSVVTFSESAMAGHGATGHEIERVSVDSDGGQGEGVYYSNYPTLTPDGRYVAFSSHAANLVDDDRNGWQDIFVHDRHNGTTERVSVASEGTEANEGSDEPSISADGRYVVFYSFASNLVSNDTNGTQDVFVHDRAMGTTELVSVSSDGDQAEGDSHHPSISADGRYVAFHSRASNLASDDSNGVMDVFVRDLTAGTTELVTSAYGDSNSANGASVAPDMTPDARYLAFSSGASNLTQEATSMDQIFIHDRQTGATELVSHTPDGDPALGRNWFPSISDDGRIVAFSSDASDLVTGDTNGAFDIFVHDRDTDLTTRVSLSSEGEQHNGLEASGASIGADGRYVAFHSDASNLVTGDSNGAYDIFVHDRVAHSTDILSVDRSGSGGNDDSYRPYVGPGGWHIVFESTASNLVEADTNGIGDIFLVYYAGQFTDIADSIFRDDINQLGQADITQGCNPPDNTRFCPTEPVTRGQMAAFLTRALGYTDPGPGDLFTDDNNSVFEGDIDRLATADITRGCNPPDNTRFCPTEPVTRGQMAAFLNRAGLSSRPRR